MTERIGSANLNEGNTESPREQRRFTNARLFGVHASYWVASTILEVTGAGLIYLSQFENTKEGATASTVGGIAFLSAGAITMVDRLVSRNKDDIGNTKIDNGNS